MNISLPQQVNKTASAVTASDGAALPLDSLTQTLAYDGSGRLSTITVTQDGAQYRQTLSYDGAGKLASVSAWVKL